jgi:hypothetical protein
VQKQKPKQGKSASDKDVTCAKTKTEQGKSASDKAGYTWGFFLTMRN